MCGIAGVVTWNDRFRITREMLGAMSARIAHRGPDAEGIWLNHDGAIGPGHPQVGLVHRRLSILDPDPRANQPFADQRGRQLVFNGEIYNFLDLRRELQQLQPHYTWRTRCDTEVLLAAYNVWGEKCVEHFNGMFAFAIWDGMSGELFCAVDRMGQKPLYWVAAAKGQAVAFASELSALREVPWCTREIDSAALGEYLRRGYVPAPMTIYRSVSKFAPATHRTFLPDESRSDRYFDPNAPAPPPPDAVAATEKLMRSAVERQLISDVPVGCFLSGGMDSSIIAAVMQASLDRPALTFSIGFDDPRYDETEYAAAVARHLGTEHRQFTVRPDAATDLPKLAAVFGEPFGDSSALPTHYLARETRRHVKVALSGDGGDELFGGYDRYRAVALSYAMDFVPFGRQVFSSRIWNHLPASHPKSALARIKRFRELARFGDVMTGYRRTMMLFDPTLLNALFLDRRNIAQMPSEPLAPSRTNPVEAALALDRATYLPGDLLTKVDRCSMLHALEVRSPFMDHELVSFAAGLTSAQLLRGGQKRLLREAFANDLPTWVFKRKKMGFAVPIGEWFRGPLRTLLRDSLFAADSFAASHFLKPMVEKLVKDHETKTADHSQRLYALLMLELWWRSAR